jgi:hypothetical protein
MNHRFEERQIGDNELPLQQSLYASLTVGRL